MPPFDVSEAASLLKESLRLSPEDGEAMMLLAQAQMAAGDYDEARKLYLALREHVEPKVASLIDFQLSLILLYEGKPKEAAARLRNLQVPPDKKALVGWIEALAKSGWRKDEKAPHGTVRAAQKVFRLGEASTVTFAEEASRYGVAKRSGGRGSGWGDFNGDGRLDLVAAGMYQPLTLFEQRGDGTFASRPIAAAGKVITDGWGVIVFDYDGDRRLDLFVTRGGKVAEAQSVLLRNRGEARFEDATESAGLYDVADSLGACVGDVDKDGWLDLFVANGNTHSGKPSRLYRNRGGGTFEETAEAAGIITEDPTINCALADFDGDDNLDLFTINTNAPHRLYLGDGAGRFTVAQNTGLQAGGFMFGALVFDADHSGLPDILIYGTVPFPETLLCLSEWPRCPKPHVSRTRFFLNQGRGRFREVPLGTHAHYGSMGAAAADLDNDGFEDVYLGTGGPPFYTLEPDVLLLNEAGGGLRDATAGSGTLSLGKGHGVSVADVNDDGFLDLYVPVGGVYPADQWKSLLYVNQGNQNHYLQVVLEGRGPNWEGIGAKLTFRTERRIYHQQVRRGVGFASSNSPVIHQGLGKETRVEEMTIKWPSGVTQRLTGLKADQRIRVREAGG